MLSLVRGLAIAGICIAVTSGVLGFFFKIGPWDYISFISVHWNARENSMDWNARENSVAAPNRPRLLPVFFFGSFAGNLPKVGGTEMLRYPFFVLVLGMSMAQVGFVDACTHGLAAFTDLFLRAGPLARLSRFWSFLFSALVFFVAYSVLVPIAAWYMGSLAGSSVAAPALIVICVAYEGLAKVRLTAQEIGVMCVDIKDMLDLSKMDVCLLSQLQAWVRNLTRLTAAFFILTAKSFGSSVPEIYVALGIVAACVNLWLGFASWDRGSSALKLKECEDSASVRTTMSADEGDARMHILPGRRYFLPALEVIILNVFSEVVRSGWVRILNLRALELQISFSRLVAVIAVVTSCFFWLSAVAGTSKAFQGALSFAFFGMGYATMGFSSGLAGLFVSAAFIGLGDSIATGLRNVRKNELRSMLRVNGHTEMYEKSIMRSLATCNRAIKIANALFVGGLGHYFGMSSVAYAVASLSVVASLFSITLDSDLARHARVPQHDGNTDVARSVCTRNPGLSTGSCSASSVHGCMVRRPFGSVA